jgi:hypothetical protein
MVTLQTVILAQARMTFLRQVNQIYASISRAS